MRLRHLAAMALAAGLTIASASQASGAAGDLDPSFGQGGTVRTLIGAYSAVKAVAVMADGRIVAAGPSDSPVSRLRRFAAARYMPDGTLDTSFAGDGTAVVRFPHDGELADMVLQPDGKVVMAGTVSVPAPTPEYPWWERRLIGLVRLRVDGTLDPTFGGDGKVTTRFAQDVDPAAVALQAGGKIVVAGSIAASAGTKVALARYLPDGTLDPGFGGDGRVISRPGWARDLVIQPDGKIVVVGTNGDLLVGRFLANGSADPSFGRGGWTVTSSEDPNYESMHGNGVALQPDGKIVAVGFQTGYDPWCDAVEYGVVARYLPQGRLDPDFGLVRFGRGECPYEEFEDVAIQRDGKIVAAAIPFMVVRFRPDGSLSTGFGTGGVAVVPQFWGAFAVAIQPDGRILAGGMDNSTFGNFALARFLPR